MFGGVFIPVSKGTKIILKNLSNITIVIVENKVEHFSYPTLYNEENFHDVQCHTVMTSSSHQVSKLHMIVEYSFLFPMV